MQTMKQLGKEPKNVQLRSDKMEEECKQKERLNKELGRVGSLWVCFSLFHLIKVTSAQWVYIEVVEWLPDNTTAAAQMSIW